VEVPSIVLLRPSAHEFIYFSRRDGPIFFLTNKQKVIFFESDVMPQPRREHCIVIVQYPSLLALSCKNPSRRVRFQFVPSSTPLMLLLCPIVSQFCPLSKLKNSGFVALNLRLHDPFSHSN
jgi:hypothetical protein